MQNSPRSRPVVGRSFLRGMFALILLAYAATWAWGVPAVITAVIENDLTRNAAAAEYYKKPWVDIDSGVTFAVPVVPGIIVLYHYHNGGLLHGWGGWKIHLWYVTGSRQLYENVSWVT